MALVTCPKCKHTMLSDKALSCPKCGLPIPSQRNEVPIAQEPKNQDAEFVNRISWIGAVPLIGLVLFALLKSPVSNIINPPAKPKTEEAQVAKPAYTPPPTVGTVVILANKEIGNEVNIFTDQRAYQEFSRFLIARDKEGIARLMVEGKIFSVASGTRARLVSNEVWSHGLYEVKMEGGQYDGSYGWVLEPFVNTP